MLPIRQIQDAPSQDHENRAEGAYFGSKDCPSDYPGLLHASRAPVGALAAATRDAVVLARKAGIEFRVAINRALSATKAAEGARATLERAGVPVAKQVLSDRVAYSQAHDVGLAAHELKSGPSRAARGDLLSLWSELLQLLAEARQRANREVHDG